VKMQLLVTLVLAVMVGAGSLNLLSAQDLSPRAYVITPVHSNAVTLTYLFSDGSIVLDGISPLTGVTGIFHAPILSFYHSLGIFGHSANITASLPYAVGTFHGTVQGEGMQIYRSGFMDSSFRFAVNIKGGPALPVQEFAKWQQKVLLGVSLKVVAPTGQYDPMKLINWGTNRWVSSQNSATPNAGAIGCSMAMEGHGSSRQTQNIFRTTSTFPERSLNHRNLWAHSRGI